MSRGGVGGVFISCIAAVLRPRSSSHPYYAGTEHVGFSPTRQALPAPQTMQPTVDNGAPGTPGTGYSPPRATSRRTMNALRPPFWLYHFIPGTCLAHLLTMAPCLPRLAFILLVVFIFTFRLLHVRMVHG